MQIDIGKNVNIPATVVDFNQEAATVKLKIDGFADDNRTPIEKYIRMKYNDIRIDSDFCK